MKKAQYSITFLLLLAVVAFAQGPPKETGAFRETELRELV